MKTILQFLQKLMQIACVFSIMALPMMSCQSETAEKKPTTTDSVAVKAPPANPNIPKGSMNADGEYAYELGDVMELKLKNGTILNVGAHSTEAKLVTLLEDSAFKVDKNKWVTLDRVYFETGSEKIKDSSKEQLENIVKIMKAYPTLVLKMGGYTDNTGDSVANVKLSGKRAQAAANFIVQKGGFLPLKVESEGYGAQHFICVENDSDACKAVNRRVDVSIREK